MDRLSCFREISPGLTLRHVPGIKFQAQMLHFEIFKALKPGATLLLNEGFIRFEVTHCDEDSENYEIVVDGTILNRKGVNVPSLVFPLSSLSDNDKSDLEFLCELYIDWITLSFFQKQGDVEDTKPWLKIAPKSYER